MLDWCSCDQVSGIAISLSEMQQYPEEVTNVVKGGLVAAVVGMFYGGIPAARHARQRFIEQSHAEVYHSRVEAVVSAYYAYLRACECMYTQ